MKLLVVVADPRRWPLDIPGGEVVSARDYLTDARYAGLGETRVFNLCRSYAYQKNGYYVSLLAAARGHRPVPSVGAMRDLGQAAVVRSAADELDELIQAALRQLSGDEFRLSVYFGRNLAKRYDRLAQAFFRLFPVPVMAANFRRGEDGRWRLTSVGAVSGGQIPEEHRPFVVERAAEFFARGGKTPRRRSGLRYDLAVLVDPESKENPTNEKGLRRFARAAAAEGMRVERITREDAGRLAEFDALFIRATTRVSHWTYAMARAAEAEGLAVIDDPESIIRCSNKVFQAERFALGRIPTPATRIVHRDDAAEVLAKTRLPCVLKSPDGAFSSGVVLAHTWEELHDRAAKLFAESDLMLIQEFLPTGFDWRIGVLDRKPLFAARYHMARGHWQIAKRDPGTKTRFGKVEAVALRKAPPDVVKQALRAAGAIGGGLYGVDVKEVAGKGLIIEVNDNPNLDAGFEDALLGPKLWKTLAASFRRRIQENHARRA